MDVTVSVTIELFGTARMACGRRKLTAYLPAKAYVSDAVAALAASCPELVGIALRDDLSGLMSSYILNLNATEFVEGGELALKEGDTLLLFSSQAGGSCTLPVHDTMYNAAYRDCR